MLDHPAGLVVVKLGGSLFDLPNLGPKLRAWLATLRAEAILIVPGGGAMVTALRELDRVHGLGPEAAHWLALRTLTLHAFWLQQLLPGAQIVAKLDSLAGMSILDAFAFMQADENQAGALPHSWEATSDSVALRAAQVSGARELVLLKSVGIPGGINWAEASRLGFVDAIFANSLASENTLKIQAVNFRQWEPVEHFATVELKRERGSGQSKKFAP